MPNYSYLSTFLKKIIFLEVECCASLIQKYFSYRQIWQNLRKKREKKSICIYDRFTMVVWKSRAAAAQICRTTTPQSKPLISHFFLHSDALFGVQQVVLTTSTSLNMQSCCHVSGWLGISFNEQHNSCSQWRSSLWCDHPRVPVSMALVSKVTLSSSLVLQRQKVDFLCFIKHNLCFPF